MRNAAFACLLLAAPAAVFAQTSATKPATVYDGVTVIDGTGSAARSNMAIIAREGRITAIVPSAQWRGKLGKEAAIAHVV
ncbi:MAG TPA: hypothetical protein VGF56_08250, partial [Rhizomicrobium sp.]